MHKHEQANLVTASYVLVVLLVAATKHLTKAAYTIKVLLELTVLGSATPSW